MKKLLILLMMLVCTSCTALPAEERAFTVAVCVEKTEDTWSVHARIPAYKTGGEYLTISGEGEDVPSAMADLNASAPMQVSLSQVRLLVLSDKLSATDVSALFEAMSTLYEVRMQCVVAVTDADAKDVADALQPETGARLSKSIDVLLEARTSQGSIPKTTLADALLMGERQSPVLTRLTLKAGEIELDGAYPLNGEGQLLSPLTKEESALLAIHRGDAKSLYLSLNGVNAHVWDACAKVSLSDDLETARVALTMHVLASSAADAGFEQAVADSCAQLLSRLSREGCDVLGLARKAIVHTENMPAWHELNWRKLLREIHWEITVQTHAPV